MVSDKEIPKALAVEVAAGSSYVMAPITLIRIQGRGKPKNFDSVITPNKIETAGAMVKIALESMVFLIWDISMPNAFAR